MVFVDYDLWIRNCVLDVWCILNRRFIEISMVEWGFIDIVYVVFYFVLGCIIVRIEVDYS